MMTVILTLSVAKGKDLNSPPWRSFAVGACPERLRPRAKRRGGGVEWAAQDDGGTR